MTALLLAQPAPAWAQGGTPEAGIELNLGRFVLLGPAAEEANLRRLAAEHGPALEAAFDLFAGLYGEAPPLPINIRLYASHGEFGALNPVVPPLAARGFHTHIGSREIAFIQPLPDNYFATDDAGNALRHELNALFLSWLTGDRLPAGLALGISQYVEVPGPQTEAAIARLETALNPQSAVPLLPWRELLDGNAVYSNMNIAYPQSLAVAAFLIDSHGFDTLVDLVRAVGEGKSYRAAFAEIYGRPMDQLESEWLAYLPQYVGGRWRHNVLFNYDLAPFETALDAGAYTQVAEAMNEVIPFLEKTGQTEALEAARGIQTEAQQGVAAGELLAAYEAARQSGDYALALDLAKQAQAAFGVLGDSPRVHGLEEHIDHLEQVLALRQALDEAAAMAAAGQPAEAEARLLELLPQFDALGDVAGRQMAVEQIEALYADQAARTTRGRAVALWLVVAAGSLVLAALFARLIQMLGRAGQRDPGSIL